VCDHPLRYEVYAFLPRQISGLKKPTFRNDSKKQHFSFYGFWKNNSKYLIIISTKYLGSEVESAHGILILG